MGRKIVNNRRRAPIDVRKRAALAKKPASSDLTRHGLTSAQVDKLFKNPGTERNISHRVSSVPGPERRVIANAGPERRVINGGKGGLKPNRPPVANRTRPHLQGDFKAPTATPFPVPPGFLNTAPVDVSIIVPMFRSGDVIERQIKNWAFEEDITTEIIYVDDDCPMDSKNKVLKGWAARGVVFPVGNIITHDSNGGFGVSCNHGALVANGKYLIFLNADTIVSPGWIRPMLDCFKDETIGLVGNLQLVTGTNRIDSLGSEWCPRTGNFIHVGKKIHNGASLHHSYTLENVPPELLKRRDVQMVTGACMMISKDLFKKIKGFDEDYRLAYWEDTDFNMKVHAAGYRVVCQPDSRIWHDVGHSRSNRHQFLSHNKNLFRKKWVDTHILDSYIENVASDRSIVPKSSIVVYTAITKDYDNLKEQNSLCRENIKFVAFSDALTANTPTWEVSPAYKDFPDSNRNAKIHKILPHRYFPDYEYSLWVDGSVVIDFNFGIEKLAEIYLAEHDMAIFKHPERSCIYQEANACLMRKLDDADTIKEQVERYTKEGYPSNLGLVEATIILRRHTPRIIAFNEAWWKEIENGSKRDQISFNYVANKLGIKYRFFPGTLRMRNYLFRVEKHKGKR